MVSRCQLVGALGASSSFCCVCAKLFAVAANGGVRWTAQTGPTVKSAPALALDGTVYHATSDGKMYALSAQGQLRWTFDFGEHLGPTPLLTSQGNGPGGGGGGANGVGSGASPTVGPDGTIYIGANNSNLYAVMPDGALKEALVDGEELLQAAHVEKRLAHSASALSWCRKQLASWLAATGSSLGTAAEQRSMTSGQRGWNGQPGGRLKGWGRAPEITGSATRVWP